MWVSELWVRLSLWEFVVSECNIRAFWKKKHKYIMAITAFDLRIRTTTHTRNNNQITNTYMTRYLITCYSQQNKETTLFDVRHFITLRRLTASVWYYKERTKNENKYKIHTDWKKRNGLTTVCLAAVIPSSFLLLLSDRRWVIPTSLPTHWARCSRARHHMHLLSHAYFT